MIITANGITAFVKFKSSWPLMSNSPQPVAFTGFSSDIRRYNEAFSCCTEISFESVEQNEKVSIPASNLAALNSSVALEANRTISIDMPLQQATGAMLRKMKLFGIAALCTIICEIPTTMNTNIIPKYANGMKPSNLLICLLTFTCCLYIT